MGLKDSEPSKSTSESEQQEAPSEDKDNNASLVDENNPLNEREQLEELIIKQRSLLKLDFSIDEYSTQHVSMTSYPIEDTFTYGANYINPDNVSTISFEAGTSSLTTYNKELIDLSNEEVLLNDSLDAVFGAQEFEGNDTNYIIGEDSDKNAYIIRFGGKGEDFTNEIIQKMGESLKTETTGTYEPFYSLFSLDLQKLKFPKINVNRTDIYAASLSIDRNDKIDSRVSITYLTGEEDQLSYSIKNKESLWETDDLYKKINDHTTESGYNIVEYSGTSENDKHFYWTDDTYFYELTFTSYNDDTTISIDDIYTVIDSAMDDDRTFENVDIVQTFNESK